MAQMFTTLKGIVKSGRKHGTWNTVPDVRKTEQKLLIKLFKGDLRVRPKSIK